MSSGQNKSSPRSKRFRPLSDDEVQQPRPSFRETLLDERSPPQPQQQTPGTLTSAAATPSLSHGDKAFFDLFSPPPSLINHSTFDQTLKRGQSERRWIIVNIQRNDNFACHRLSRDVWRGESVVEIITASFIFWQRQAEHPDGVAFNTLYGVNSFPFVGVVDPRTGRLVKSWDTKRFDDELSAASELMDFLDARAAEKFFNPDVQPRTAATNDRSEIIMDVKQMTSSSSSSSSTSNQTPPNSMRAIAKEPFSSSTDGLQREADSSIADVAEYHHDSNLLLKQLFEERMKRRKGASTNNDCDDQPRPSIN